MPSPAPADALAYTIRFVSGCIVRRFPELNPAQPVVFYANHTSNLDFPVIWAALPHALRQRVRPVAGRDYWSKGPVRTFLAKKVFNAVLIERKSVNRENNPLAPMQAALDDGTSLIIFPEGTRSPSGEIGPFKSGIHHLAQNNPGIAFVPVYLENLFRILPKGEVFPLPLVATLHFGDPIEARDGGDRDTFLNRTRSALADLSTNLSRNDIPDPVEMPR